MFIKLKIWKYHLYIILKKRKIYELLDRLYADINPAIISMIWLPDLSELESINNNKIMRLLSVCHRINARIILVQNQRFLQIKNLLTSSGLGFAMFWVKFTGLYQKWLFENYFSYKKLKLLINTHKGSI